MTRKILKSLSPAANLDRNMLSLKFARDLSSPIFEWMKELENNNKKLVSCSVSISNAEVLIDTNPWFRKMHREVLGRVESLDTQDYLSIYNKSKFRDENPESVRI